MIDALGEDAAILDTLEALTWATAAVTVCPSWKYYATDNSADSKLSVRSRSVGIPRNHLANWLTIMPAAMLAQLFLKTMHNFSLCLVVWGDDF